MDVLALKPAPVQVRLYLCCLLCLLCLSDAAHSVCIVLPVLAEIRMRVCFLLLLVRVSVCVPACFSFLNIFVCVCTLSKRSVSALVCCSLRCCKQWQCTRSSYTHTPNRQVTWIGYPNTTGLPTVDYRLADQITDPPDSAQQVRARGRFRVCVCSCVFVPPWVCVLSRMDYPPRRRQAPTTARGCCPFVAFLDMRSCALTHHSSHACTHTLTHSHSYTCMLIRLHTHTHAHMHTLTHACACSHSFSHRPLVLNPFSPVC